jgi:hypothetical protein
MRKCSKMSADRRWLFRSFGVLAFLGIPALRAEAPPKLQEAQKTVERVRGREFKHGVASEEIDVSRLRSDLSKKFDEGLGTDTDTYFRSLAALGLLAKSDLPGLKERLLDFYGSQVLAFYDPSAGKFFVSESGRKKLAGFGQAEESLLLTHELTHALQDQYLSLDRRMRSLKNEGDAAMALQGLLEGEATEVMIEGALGELSDSDAGIEDALAPLLTASLTDLDPEAQKVPDFFTQQLFFPYSEGTAYIRAEKRNGGWKAIDRLWNDPPKSTSEILHPGARPVAVGDLLPPRLVPPVGATPAYRDTLGEWTLRFLLRHQGAEEPDQLAAAWRGDRFAFFRKGDDVDYVGRLRAADPSSAKSILAAWQKSAPGSRGLVRGSDVIVFTGYEKSPI